MIPKGRHGARVHLSGSDGVDGVLMVAVIVLPNFSSVTGSGQEIEDQVAL